MSDTSRGFVRICLRKDAAGGLLGNNETYITVSTSGFIPLCSLHTCRNLHNHSLAEVIMPKLKRNLHDRNHSSRPYRHPSTSSNNVKPDANDHYGPSHPPSPPILRLSNAYVDKRELDPGHKTVHDDNFWTFHQIIRVKGERCQVSWMDNILSGKELSHGVLHGKGLREHAKHIKVLSDGLSQVTWYPTWEPVEDWIDRLGNMSHDPRFQQKVVKKVADGFVAQCYSPCVVHRSLLNSSSLGSKPLIEEMASYEPFHTHHDGDSDNDGDGDGDLLHITWRLHWKEAIESV